MESSGPHPCNAETGLNNFVAIPKETWAGNLPSLFWTLERGLRLTRVFVRQHSEKKGTITVPLGTIATNSTLFVEGNLFSLNNHVYPKKNAT